MKNNILIIAGVTIVALGVIAAVILASVLNSGEQYSDSESESNGGSVVISQSSETSEPPSDSTSGDDPFSESSYPYETSDDSSDSSGAEEAMGIVAMANSLIGVPFLENGSDPDGFDNSGFIYYVLRENGYITCPRGTEAQSGMGTRIDYDSVKEGDLVFFGNEGNSEANFGGIYVGGGKMIACLMPGTLVREVDITTDYYRGNFFCGVSLS